MMREKRTNIMGLGGLTESKTVKGCTQLIITPSITYRTAECKAKDPLPLDSSQDSVVKRSRCVNSRFLGVPW